MTKTKTTIAIFGTALEDEPIALKNAKELTKLLVDKSNLRVATGGQKAGTMKVITETAHQIAQEKNDPSLEPIGFAMTAWGPMDVGDIKIVNTLCEKAQMLIDSADAYVALNGRVGTFVETILALHCINVRKVQEWKKKPLIILDSSKKLEKAINWLDENYDLFKNYPDLKELIFIVNTPKEAHDIIKDFLSKPSN